VVCPICGMITYLGHRVGLVGRRSVYEEFICFACGDWLDMVAEADRRKQHSIEAIVKRHLSRTAIVVGREPVALVLIDYLDPDRVQ